MPFSFGPPVGNYSGFSFCGNGSGSPTTAARSMPPRRLAQGKSPMTTVLKDGTDKITLHSITAMSGYEHNSFEELRLEHYLASGKTLPTDALTKANNNASNNGVATFASLFGAASTGNHSLFSFGGNGNAANTTSSTTPVLARLRTHSAKKSSIKKKLIERSILRFETKKRKSEQCRSSWLDKKLLDAIEEEDCKSGVDDMMMDRMSKTLESSLDGYYWAESGCSKKCRREQE